MSHDVMAVLKSSKNLFVRKLIGDDPVAIYRWSLIRSAIRALFAFRSVLKKNNKRSGKKI